MYAIRSYYSLEFVGNLLFYTPNKDYFGIDSLTYKAQDNESYNFV